MKKLVLASAVAMALSVSAAYAGDIVTINPDAAGGDAAFQAGALGWQNGNAIALDATNPQVGDTFQTYTHASLANFTNATGNPIGGLDLNSTYEWTYVAGFSETVTKSEGAIPVQNADFQVIAGGDNFFRIYYDSTPDADNLTGTGFSNGTLILEGTVLPFNALTGEGASSFNATGLADALDTALGVNNYPNIATIVGNGSTNVLIDVDFYDPLFFTGIIDLLALNFDAFQNTPYQQQNPSSCFWDGTAYINGAGPITGGTAAQTAAQCGVNSVGAINGVSGPNFMFETRGSSAFVSAVPEPASLALLGAGLIGFGLARRRKNQA